MPPLLLVAGAFVTGTGVSAALGGPWWGTALVAMSLAGAAALQWPRYSRLVLVAAVALTAAGHARFQAADNEALPALASIEGTHDIVAVAREDAVVRGAQATVDLTVERLDGAETSGGIRLRLPAPREPLREGDRVAFTADVERPPEVEAFDYAAYLRGRGIHAVAAYPERWAVVGRADRGAITEALRSVRRWATANIERSLPEPESSLATGMLIGARRSMPSDLSEDLRLTGTTHLVVVSGQNVALVLGTAVALLTVIMPRRRAGLVVLALLPAYVVLVGAEPPVLRAAVMAAGIALGAALGRRTPAWVYLLYAAALMLAVDPMLARDVAFQLSAAATAGVLVVAPALRDALLARLGPRGATWEALIEAGAVTVGAGLAVLPIQVAVFEQVSLVQIPANLLVAPLYEGTLTVATAAALFGWLEPVALLVREAGRLLPAAFVGLVGMCADVPGAAAPVRASLPFALAWYGALALGLRVIARHEAPERLAGGGRGHARTVALGVVAGGLWLAALSPRDDLATVTVLDVGQGLAVLIEDGGRGVLVDAGPPDGAVLNALPRAGHRSSLNAVVLTQPDADHAGGLAPLEQRMALDRVFAGYEVTGRRAVTTERLDIGDRLRVGGRTTIELLSPPVLAVGDAHEGNNNGSLVLLVTVGQRRVLLPADIEAPAERWLATSGLDLRADALVVPHHGSKTSSTREFLDAVRPQVAVVSVGARNSYGHPHPEVLARYEGVRLFRTDQHGDVALRSDGERLWVDASR